MAEDRPEALRDGLRALEELRELARLAASLRRFGRVERPLVRDVGEPLRQRARGDEDMAEGADDVPQRLAHRAEHPGVVAADRLDVLAERGAADQLAALLCRVAEHRRCLRDDLVHRRERAHRRLEPCRGAGEEPVRGRGAQFVELRLHPLEHPHERLRGRRQLVELLVEVRRRERRAGQRLLRRELRVRQRLRCAHGRAAGIAQAAVSFGDRTGRVGDVLPCRDDLGCVADAARLRGVQIDERAGAVHLRVTDGVLGQCDLVAGASDGLGRRGSLDGRERALSVGGFAARIRDGALCILDASAGRGDFILRRPGFERLESSLRAGGIACRITHGVLRVGERQCRGGRIDPGGERDAGDLDARLGRVHPLRGADRLRCHLRARRGESRL